MSTTGPGPPRQFNGLVMSDMDAVYLSWKDPINSNGILRFYYIRIFDTKTGQQVKNLVNKTAMKEDSTGTQYQLIANLKAFTNYTFTIQAVTIKPGEMANFTARTDEGGIYDSSPFLQSTLVAADTLGTVIRSGIRIIEARCD